MPLEVPVKIKFGVDGMNEAVSEAKKVAGAVSALFATDKIISYAKISLENYSKLRIESNLLAASLGYQSQELVKLAKERANTSKFETYEILQGEKVLSQYTKKQSEIKALVPAMMNLAIRTGDMATAAKLLGSTFDSGTGRLKMYGIHVSGAAHSQELLNSITKETIETLGNQNNAYYEAMSPLEKIHKTFGDISETVGESVLPAFEKLNDFLMKHKDAIESVAKLIAKNIEVIAFVGVASAIAIAAPVIISNFNMIMTAMAANPIIAAAAAIGLLTNAIATWADTAADKKLENAVSAMAESHKKTAEIARENAQILEAQLKTGKGMIGYLDAEGNAVSLTVEEARKKLAVYKREAELFGQAAENYGKGTPKKTKGTGEENGEQAEAFKKIYDLGVKYAEEEQNRINETNLKGSEWRLKNLEDEVKRAREIKDKEIDDYNRNLDDQRRKQYEYQKKNDNEKAKLEDKYLKNDIQKIKDNYKKERYYAQDNSELIAAINRREADEIEKTEKRVMEMKVQFYANAASEALGNLQIIAEATHANARTMKAIAISQAIINTAVGVTKDLSEYSMPLAAIMAALTIAAGAAEIATISQQKMAYGGVVRGGTPGVDSVPAMLMPGEIVYNPANPNPAIASMIQGNTTSNNNTTNHIGGTTVIINGNPSKSDIEAVGKITERSLIAALRKAQNSGKITANGLLVRS